MRWFILVRCLWGKFFHRSTLAQILKGFCRDREILMRGYLRILDLSLRKLTVGLINLPHISYLVGYLEMIGCGIDKDLLFIFLLSSITWCWTATRFFHKFVLLLFLASHIVIICLKGPYGNCHIFSQDHKSFSCSFPFLTHRFGCYPDFRCIAFHALTSYVLLVYLFGQFIISVFLFWFCDLWCLAPDFPFIFVFSWGSIQLFYITLSVSISSIVQPETAFVFHRKVVLFFQAIHWFLHSF